MAGGFQLQVSVFGETQLNRRFLSTAAFLDDPRPAFNEIADAIMDAEKRQFASEGGNTGGWTGLAPSTVAERVRLGIGGAHPILDRTGASYDGHAGGQLKRSLTVKGAAGQELIINRDFMVFRSTVPYGKHVQKHRKAFALTETDKKQPFRIYQAHMQRAMA